MIRFSLLGSGSAGNAVLVASPSARILIDNGLSYRRLLLRMAALGESVEHVRAVFVTHEHGDHTLGLGTLARKLGIPVYMTEGTRGALRKGMGELPRVEIIEPGEAIALDGLTVESFSVSHDAADPVSYVVRSNGVQLGFASDLGHVSNVVRTRLRGSHGLVVESNYCPDMLRRGKYPPSVQQRIRGRHGHLSNGDTCSLLSELAHDGLRLVVLVHISEENNDAGLAREMAMRALARCAGSTPPEVYVATQDQPTELFELT